MRRSRMAPSALAPALCSRRAPICRFEISLAGARDRRDAAARRHDVYARELGQHPENERGELGDRLDEVNVCLVARAGEELAGFVTVTPPNALGYSIDKYFARDRLPFAFDDTLF